MKKKSVLFFFIFTQLLFASYAYSAESISPTIAQMDKAELIIYGEPRRGGLIDRLNELETVLFGRSLPGSIAERQLQLLNFIQTGSAEQPSLLFKLGIAEWAVSQTTQPFIPALGRLQRLEQDLEGFIQEGNPVAMRVERVLAILLTDPVIQTELVVSSDRAIRAQFLEDIGPGKSRVGDSVKIEILEDFTMDNYLIAPRGSRIVAEVSGIRRPGLVGQAGEVRLDLKYLQILGPEELKVKVVDPERLGGRRGTGIATAAGVSIVGVALLGPVGLIPGLLIRGPSLDINAGTQFYIEMVEDARLSAFPIPPGLRRIDNFPDDRGGGGNVRSSGNVRDRVVHDDSDSDLFYLP